MGQSTEISWCDHTFNPWMGCTKVSPACQHCCAERNMDHRFGKVAWGPSGTRVKTPEADWHQPMEWNTLWEKEFDLYDRHGTDVNPRRTRVFCGIPTDLFEDWDGPIRNHKGKILNERGAEAWNADMHNHELLTMDGLRRDLFDLIDSTPHLDWLLLTKRPENVRKMWPKPVNKVVDDMWDRDSLAKHLIGSEQGRPNVWIGTSVENQEQADKRIPGLIKCRDLSPVLFLSCEPLLGSLGLNRLNEVNGFAEPGIDGVDWVIAGGESGPNARPVDRPARAADRAVGSRTRSSNYCGPTRR